jgi:hypothetical protein
VLLCIWCHLSVPRYLLELHVNISTRWSFFFFFEIQGRDVGLLTFAEIKETLEIFDAGFEVCKYRLAINMPHGNRVRHSDAEQVTSLEIERFDFKLPKLQRDGK